MKNRRQQNCTIDIILYYFHDDSLRPNLDILKSLKLYNCNVINYHNAYRYVTIDYTIQYSNMLYRSVA